MSFSFQTAGLFFNIVTIGFELYYRYSPIFQISSCTHTPADYLKLERVPIIYHDTCLLLHTVACGRGFRHPNNLLKRKHSKSTADKVNHVDCYKIGLAYFCVLAHLNFIFNVQHYTSILSRGSILGPCKARHQDLCPINIEHLSLATCFSSFSLGFVITVNNNFPKAVHRCW